MLAPMEGKDYPTMTKCIDAIHGEVRVFDEVNDNETSMSENFSGTSSPEIFDKDNDEYKETREKSVLLSESGKDQKLTGLAQNADEKPDITPDNYHKGDSYIVVKNNIELNESPSMISARDIPEHLYVTSSENSKRDSDEESLVSPDALVSQSQKSTNTTTKRGKRKKYQKYTPEDRIAIGKYCFEHGPAAARKAFQSRYPEMSESVTRGFRDKYKLMIGESAVYEYELQRRKKELEKRIEPLPRGRPRKIIPVEENYSLPSMVISSSPNNKPFSGQESPMVNGENEREYRSSSETKLDSPLEKRQTSPREHQPEQREPNVPKAYDIVKKSPFSFRDVRDDDKIKIGRFYSKYGLNASLREFIDDFPVLSEEMIMSCYRYYIETVSVSRSKPNQVSGSYYRRILDSAKENRIEGHGIYEKYEKAYPYSHPRSPPRVKYTDIVKRERSPPYQREELSHSPIDRIPIVSSINSNSSSSAIIHYPKISPKSDPSNNKDAYDYINRQNINRTGSPIYYEREYPYGRHSISPSQDEHLISSTQEPRSKRFKYQKYTPEDRFSIGKLCNDIGLAATVKVYREKFPRLNESVVRTFRNRYRELLEKGNGTPEIEAIERKPSVRKSTTTAAIENEVVSQLLQFRISQIELTENLVLAVTENIIAGKNPKDVAGIRSLITREWANSLLWKHKLIDKPVGNSQGVCCERCKTYLVCPKC